MSVWGDVRSALGLDEARPPARRPVKVHRGSPGPKHAPRVPFAVLVVTLIAGGMGLLLLLNTASAANEVRRHDLAAQDAGVAAQVQELENEVAASSAPGNLAQAAAELGMVPAGNPAFLVVGADGSVRVMGRPAPVSGAAVARIPAKTKPKKTTSPTKTAKSSKTASSNKSKTASSKSTGAGHSTASTKTAPATPTPTPTPTPTVTLPGGNR
jgi:hypothetical protein